MTITYKFVPENGSVARCPICQRKDCHTDCRMDPPSLAECASEIIGSPSHNNDTPKPVIQLIQKDEDEYDINPEIPLLLNYA